MNRQEKYIVLKNCNIIPMDVDTILRTKNLVLSSGNIITISDKIDKKYLENGSKIIDCTDKFVLPGLFDSHFHYGRNKDLYPISDSLLLNSGITNVFSFHGSKELMDHKKRIDNYNIIGPVIISTGRNQRDPELSKENALKRIKEHKRIGFEFIKVYTNLSKEAFETFDRFALEEDIRLVGHIPRAIGFFDLMETNQELIVHSEEFLYNEPVNYLMGLDEATEPDYNLTDTIANILNKNDKWVSPTLVSFQSILIQARTQKLEHPKSPAVKTIADYWNWFPPNNSIPLKFDTEGKLYRLEKGFLFQKLLVEKMYENKVKMLAGTDSPAYWNLVPGKSLHKELELLHDCGLPEYEVLKTATVNPSIFLKVSDRYGTVEKGKSANLLILNKNPLDDIKYTTDIFKVILNGKEL